MNNELNIFKIHKEFNANKIYDLIVKFSAEFEPLFPNKYNWSKSKLLVQIDNHICEFYNSNFNFCNYYPFTNNLIFTGNFVIEGSKSNKFHKGIIDKYWLNENFEESLKINSPLSIYELFLYKTEFSKFTKPKVFKDKELFNYALERKLYYDLKRFYMMGCIRDEFRFIDQISCYPELSKEIDFDSIINKKNYVQELIDIKNHEVDFGWRSMEAKSFYEKMSLKDKKEINIEDLLVDFSFSRLAKYKGDIVNSISIGEIELNLIRLDFKNKKTPFTLNGNFEHPDNLKFNYEILFPDENVKHDFMMLSVGLENDIRVALNLPKVGEGWISETNLYYSLKNHFHTEFVVQHGRPNWLGKQHLDIYFPKHNIAVEYQGDQHYYPIDFFGGLDSFEKNVQRDKLKKELCIKNDCKLIFVNPDYNLENIINEINYFLIIKG
jgi:hypothetical protein